MTEYMVTTTTHAEGDAQTFRSLYNAHLYAQGLVEDGFTPHIERYRGGSTSVLTWAQLCEMVGGE